MHLQLAFQRRRAQVPLVLGIAVIIYIGNTDAEILDEIDRGQAEQIAHLKVDEEMAERDGTKQLEEYAASAEQRRRQQELEEMKAKLSGRARVEAEEANQVGEAQEEAETDGPKKSI